MAIDPISVSDPAPSWFTPKWLLVFFCLINMINYIDRGAISTNGVNGSPRSCTESNVCSDGSGIQGEFDLSNFKDGILSSAFLVGLLIASPIFASLAQSINPFRLIGVGLSVWTLAVVGCGFSVDFWSITICRMLVGVGEASFIGLAAPFIDENAPVAQRTAWLGIFCMCLPIGIAVGDVYGGLVGDGLGWRYAFFGEAILMLPFAILGFVMKPLQMKGMSNNIIPGFLNEELSKKDFSSYVSFTSNLLSRFGQDMKALLSEKVYVVNVLGYISYNFVIGAYQYWSPKVIYGIYETENADLLFGGVIIVGGIVGTIGGSVLLDRMNSTIPNAFKGPVNFVCLHAVKPSLRPLAMAISSVSIRIFGDVPSPPLFGILQDKVDNWRTSVWILNSILFLAAGIWFIGIFLPSVDRYEEDSEHLGTRVEQPDVTPFLESKMADGDTTSAVYKGKGKTKRLL
ncbi:probable sphingolipid transporter spinster homolog 2 isoform X2 [Lactuca sativa]|uniref:probable sphingolipid transporter spinster homolog 2 isoform X2 n=1 Tax=Lactuca sativa TaxID=4236 RepID=UPI000CD96F23|nr:probable sphingolipid transporter spinster homolog 2 isoform X2 [Lactuca sativa]